MAPDLGNNNNSNNNGNRKTRNSLKNFNEKELVDSLDHNSKTLWILLNHKLDSKLDALNKKIDSQDTRIRFLEDEVATLQKQINKSVPVVNEIPVVKEINEREHKKKNFMIFKLDDSTEAVKSDSQIVKNFFVSSGLTLPFQVDDIKVTRFGSKFVEGSSRPLQVKLKNVDQVHWVFKNKEVIFPGNLTIARDQTKSQRNYFKVVKEELQTRQNNGEKDLEIRHFYDIPCIQRKRRKETESL